MFKNQLAHYETYSKNYSEYDLETSVTCYEVFIELSKDKDGNVLKNRDGSDRYYAIDDANIKELDKEVEVKEIRPNFYKDVYQVNGDYVEKVERDGKRIYYVVPAEKVTKLAAGTKVVIRNGTYRVPSEIGYVLVDDKIIESPKTIAVRKFKTDDHKAEAEALVKGANRRNNREAE